MRPLALAVPIATFLAAPIAAQQAAGTPLSLGADIGMFAPFESGSSSSFTARVTADFYSWGPLGVRFAAGFANPELGNEAFEGRADMVYASAGLVRELRDVHLRPYGHVGVGIYHLSGDVSGTQLGLSFGGGLQFPLSTRHLLLAPELSAHLISGDAPRFSLALTVGLHTTPE
jgi:Outer membrane protein beta-barrel domain